MALTAPGIWLMCFVAVFAQPVAASAAVLAIGRGVGATAEAADAAARADLALRLQRRAAARIESLTGEAAHALRQAVFPGRELPLINVEVAKTGRRGAELLYEARLTDASIAAYERQARQLARELSRHKPDGAFMNAVARLDQYRRVRAVLGLFSDTVRPEAGAAGAAWREAAAKALAPLAGATDVARAVKLDLDRGAIAVSRVVAPVRADTGEATALSASIAEELRAALGVAAGGNGAAHTLEGTYAQIDGKVLLTLFLLDASFNTRRAFVFALASPAEARPRAVPALVQTLNRGLVRVQAPAGTPPGDDGIEVQVRMGRGNRGLYYRPGERDELLVKLDRAGYYYIVGHLQKETVRFSYLMEVGGPGATDRFIRRVSEKQADRWQTVGEFTVALPVGLEAIQVIATSGPPEGMLPPTRFDPARKLHLIGTDPVAAVKRARGLVRVDLPKPGKEPAATSKPPAFAVGEAVLQFSTLP